MKASDPATARRTVIFNAPRVSVFDDDEEKEKESVASEEWNERLRHEAPRIAQVITLNDLPDVIARSAAVVLQQSLEEISILREMKGIKFEDVNLENVSLQEQYATPKYDMELIINQSPVFLELRKFRRDISWLEKIFTITIKNLQRSRGFDDLLTIITDQESIKQTEHSILTSRKFNQNEITKLRFYLDSEKENTLKRIQELTEQLGICKDELNDQLVEYQVKIEYLKKWQNSRNEQNQQILKNKEQEYFDNTRKMKVDIDREERIHEELVLFLEETLEDYKLGIEDWMEKYDRELEEKEKNSIQMKQKLERQREEYLKLMEEYDARQQAMEAYIEHKRLKRIEYEEIQRRTKAATKIQSWWRGVMFRKGLGPFRKKKGKGKKGGSSKNKK